MTAAQFRILHPTDFSTGAQKAFAHALWIALFMKARLDLLHVETGDSGEAYGPDWSAFPHIRETLALWGLVGEGETPQELQDRLGIRIAKISSPGDSVAHGVARFVGQHGCDLMVISTHDRHGLLRWRGDSAAEAAARAIPTPTLFVSERAEGFVDPQTGYGGLDEVLIPLDGDLQALSALRRIDSIVQPVAPEAKINLLHVGAQAPVISDENGVEYDLPVVLRDGPVVETILAFAAECRAGLIAMPTAGRHGFLDALRGSTTQRVLHEARCPVLAAPIG
jgi:nucleotide-binding universal stress UspA family protein